MLLNWRGESLNQPGEQSLNQAALNSVDALCDRFALARCFCLQQDIFPFLEVTC